MKGRTLLVNKYGGGNAEPISEAALKVKLKRLGVINPAGKAADEVNLIATKDKITISTKGGHAISLTPITAKALSRQLYKMAQIAEAIDEEI